jgi:hypothetical protein
MTKDRCFNAVTGNKDEFLVEARRILGFCHNENPDGRSFIQCVEQNDIYAVSQLIPVQYGTSHSYTMRPELWAIMMILMQGDKTDLHLLAHHAKSTDLEIKDSALSAFLLMAAQHFDSVKMELEESPTNTHWILIVPFVEKKEEVPQEMLGLGSRLNF